MPNMSLFLALKGDSEENSIAFAPPLRERKSVYNWYRDSWKSNNYSDQSRKELKNKNQNEAQKNKSNNNIGEQKRNKKI